MKKTILALLMVIMTATPCLAQEVETDGISSVEGTLWRLDVMSFYTRPPFVQRYTDGSIGFYQDVVYFCDEYSGCRTREDITVIETPLGTIGMMVFIIPLDVHIEMQIYLRNGFGVVIGFGVGIHGIPSSYFEIGNMFKVDDNWKEPPVISDISPSSGEQGTTLTDVTITGINTTFQDDPPVEISFDPPDGLTVSNINVISNTRIEFDLESADDAPVGKNQIFVVFGIGKGSGMVSFIFDVMEKTN